VSLEIGDEIEGWDEWRRADEAMIVVVQAAMRANLVAKTPTEKAASKATYTSLLRQWESLKSLGLGVVDKDIANSGLLTQIVDINAEIAKAAGEIKNLANAIDDIAKFLSELAKIGTQIQSLLGLFAKLTL